MIDLDTYEAWMKKHPDLSWLIPFFVGFPVGVLLTMWLIHTA